MKKNLLLEVKSENLDKLMERLSKEKKELTSLNLELKTKKLKDIRKIFHKRKDISQILTVIGEKRRKI